MPSSWLVALAWVALTLGFASAGWILTDIFGRHRRQRVAVMEAVWPLTAMYFGPIAVWGYRRLGRSIMAQHHSANAPPFRPRWSSIALSVSHCGAGCVLGDVLAEFAVFGFAVSIAGEALYAEYIADYLLAISLGIIFQYLVIGQMRGLTRRNGLIAAAKSDFAALTAFEVGLFGWMALMRFVFFPDPRLGPNSPVYWLFMQIGMVIGFATSWPANVWLIRRGIKDAM